MNITDLTSKGAVVLTGVIGTGAVEAVSEVDLSAALQLIIQIVIAIATLWKLLKKPKKKE